MNTVFENMKFTNTSSIREASIFAAFVFTLQSYENLAKYRNVYANDMGGLSGFELCGNHGVIVGGVACDFPADPGRVGDGGI